jgi:hypothetical protein
MVRALMRLLGVYGDVRAASRGRLMQRMVWKSARRTLRRAGRRAGWW